MQRTISKDELSSTHLWVQATEGITLEPVKSCPKSGELPKAEAARLTFHPGAKRAKTQTDIIIK